MFNNGTRNIKLIQNKSKKKKSNDTTIYIQNPMVISVGIGVYPMHGDVDAIYIDVNNMKALCDTMNYKLFPSYDEYPKEEWTKKELIDLLKTQADILNSNVNQNHGEDVFDGLIVAISGRGQKYQTMASDDGVNDIDLYRIFSQYPSLRELPRIFIFDTGHGDHSYYDDCWDRGRPHPDYKLGIVTFYILFLTNDFFIIKLSDLLHSNYPNRNTWIQNSISMLHLHYLYEILIFYC